MRHTYTHFATLTVLTSSVLLITGCGTVKTALNNDVAIDYKSSQPAKTLEIPPDLTQLKVSPQYQWDSKAGIQQPIQMNNNQQVLPTSSVARIERLGNQRYIMVNLPAEQVYPVLVQFWESQGFKLTVNNPQTGTIETDWTENKAHKPASGLRKLLGGLADGLFDSGLRDKFKTRIERTAQNTTEVYVTHKGTKEVSDSVSIANDSEIKTHTRNSDIALESEFLQRMVLQFGGVHQATSTTISASELNTQSIKTTEPIQAQARLISRDNQDALEIDDTFDSAWRRIGLILDRNEFTVLNRNVEQGTYTLEYANGTSIKEAGFFKKLFKQQDKALPPSVTDTVVLTLSKGTSPVLTVKPNVTTPNAQITPAIKSVLNRLLEELK